MQTFSLCDGSYYRWGCGSGWEWRWGFGRCCAGSGTAQQNLLPPSGLGYHRISQRCFQGFCVELLQYWSVEAAVSFLNLIFSNLWITFIWMLSLFAILQTIFIWRLPEPFIGATCGVRTPYSACNESANSRHHLVIFAVPGEHRQYKPYNAWTAFTTLHSCSCVSVK